MAAAALGLQIPCLHHRAVLPRSVWDPSLHALLSCPNKVANHSSVAAVPGRSPGGKCLSVGDTQSVSCDKTKKAVVGRLAPHSLRHGKARGEAGEEAATVWVKVWQRCLPGQAQNAKAGWSAARLNQAKCSHPMARWVRPERLLQPCVGVLTLTPLPPPAPQLRSPCALGQRGLGCRDAAACKRPSSSLWP